MAREHRARLLREARAAEAHAQREARRRTLLAQHIRFAADRAYDISYFALFGNPHARDAIEADGWNRMLTPDDIARQLAMYADDMRDLYDIADIIEDKSSTVYVWVSALHCLDTMVREDVPMLADEIRARMARLPDTEWAPALTARRDKHGRIRMVHA